MEVTDHTKRYKMELSKPFKYNMKNSNHKNIKNCESDRNLR